MIEQQINTNPDNFTGMEQLYVSERTTRDLLDRSRSGGIFYAFGALFAFLSDELFVSHSTIGFSLLIILGFMTAVRYFVSYQEGKENHNKINAIIWSYTYGNGLAWAVGSIWLLGYTHYENAQFIWILCTVMYASAMSSQNSIHKNQARIGVFLLMLPMALSLWLINEDKGYVALSIFVFTLYLQLITGINHKEYFRQLNVEMTALRNERALEILSKTDSLTGLFNRRHFSEEIDQFCKLSARKNIDIALAILDLDHFKKINDKYGHNIGDECLKHAARNMQAIFQRDTDIIARIGGEEFAILMPHTTQEQAIHLCQKLISILNENKVINYSGDIKVTASIGLSVWLPEDGDSAEELIKRADTLSYKAKDKGRNQLQHT